MMLFLLVKVVTESAVLVFNVVGVARRAATPVAENHRAAFENLILSGALAKTVRSAGVTARLLSGDLAGLAQRQAVMLDSEWHKPLCHKNVCKVKSESDNRRPSGFQAPQLQVAELDLPAGDPLRVRPLADRSRGALGIMRVEHFLAVID